MKVSRIILKNWFNFQSIDVLLQDRVFLIGANASGKSNFLDAFRFLHDIAKMGGGLQRAVSTRHGLSSVRCFTAQKSSQVELEVHLTEAISHKISQFKYAIGIKKTRNNPISLAYERVWKDNELLIERPNKEDKQDVLRLTQTYLEQISMNAAFREIAHFLGKVLYLHIVPQSLRHQDVSLNQGVTENAFGRTFLKQLAETPEKTRQSRLKQIEKGLRIAIPQFKRLTYIKDERDIPHLEAIYEPWERKRVSLRENQFSDGTLRLIGLFWALLESDSLLLLEEPELSLNGRIVNELAPLIYRVQHPKQGQVILSTHSWELLSDKGIAGEEVLLLTPDQKGTQVELASSIKEVRHLLKAGLSIADAALSRTKPPALEQQSLLI
ncbi:MAG TPA: chromosome segregation protein SMC [Thiotrichaceae bacterium]|nr:chromosome segregation protein SMC [Thiotrichaceae bacterium]